MYVVNFDQLSEYERRQHQLHDIPLGKRGVPVRGIAYFAVIAILVFVVFKFSGLAALAWSAGGSNGILLVLMMFVGLPLGLTWIATQQMPGGLPMHHLLSPALTYFTTARKLIGWLPAPETPGYVWRPGELVVEPDIADAATPHMKLTGPARLLIGHEYERVDALGGLRGAVAREEAAATFEISDEPRAGGRGVSVPAGVTVFVKRSRA